MLTPDSSLPLNKIQDSPLQDQTTDDLQRTPLDYLDNLIESRITNKLEKLSEIPADFKCTLIDVLKKIDTIVDNPNFDNKYFQESLNEYVAKDFLAQYKQLSNKAITVAKQSGKITIFEEEQTVTVNLPKNLRQDYAGTITDAEPPKFEPHIIDFEDTAETNELIDYNTTPLVTLLFDYIDSIPSMDDFEEYVTTQFPAFFIHKDDFDWAKNITQEFMRSRIAKNCFRKQRKLDEVLDEFIKNPESTLAKWYFESQKNIITSKNQELAENYIATLSTDFYKKLDFSQLKSKGVHVKPEHEKLSKRQKRQLKASLNPIVSVEPVPDSEYENVEQFHDITDVGITLPWVNSGETTTYSMTELQCGRNSTYIINGIDDKLQTIANETLDKNELAQKITNALWQQARLLNSGNMPWDNNSNSVRSVKKSRKSPDIYNDVDIWYTFDLSPNSPRVYFTIINSSLIETTNKLKPNSNCIVVMAITDKQNQIDVLKRFTGKNRTQLRADGAGSV